MVYHRFRSVYRTLVCSTALVSASFVARAQTAPPAGEKLLLHAALVLTPEFCATKAKKGTWMVNQESFNIGKVVCADLPPALKNVFASVTTVEDATAVGDVQVVLTPKSLDVTATQAKFAFSNRELVLSIELTAKDKAGKTLWVETVEGSAKHHMGNTFTYKKNLNLIVNDSSKSLAEHSASRAAASQQLRDLANRSGAAAAEKQ